ncbi:hypothetical protein LINGRAPRIM_LOCUS760 [Linum grandiflorum]
MSIPTDDILALVIRWLCSDLRSKNRTVNIRLSGYCGVGEFAFHPSLDVAVSSFDHRRFQAADDEETAAR